MNNVKLIGVTQPTISNEVTRNWMTAEQLIAYCARVSNPANQDNPDSERLLKYLVKNKHWSPFEMVHVIMEIRTTRDIGRQILRHRSFSFQEFSQRYAEVSDSMFEQREARLQDTKNRQNSIENEDGHLDIEFRLAQHKVTELAKSAYKWAIENGIAKEVARSVLPEGLTMSRMYMSGSLRSWITYIALREKNGTQKEHKLIALECKKIICEQFPSIATALGGASEEWII